MDDLVNYLMSFTPSSSSLSDKQYDEVISAQLEEIKKWNPLKLTQKTSHGRSLLDFIDPGEHTVSYALALVAQLEADKPKTKDNDGGLWLKMAEFLEKFDQRQIRYVGSEFSKIMETVVFLAERAHQPEQAVLPLATALCRLDPDHSVLTSHHLILARLALETGVITPALPILESFILYFPTKLETTKPKYKCDISLQAQAWITYTNGFTGLLKSQDVLEYFMFCGTAFISLRRWTDAADALENAVRFPSKDGSVSKIMVEAYKKWLIVNLLLKGENVKLPSTTSSHASKAYHTLAKAYETVATIFETGKADRLKEEIEFGQRTWQTDHNLGLMLEVLAAYQKFGIRNLGKVYSRVSINEVTQLTYSAETGDRLPSDDATEALIRDMISQKTLLAALSRSAVGSLILTFDPPAVLNEQDFKQALAYEVEQLQKLGDDVKHTNRRLALDKDYIKWSQKQKKLGKDGNTGAADENMNWQSGADPIDEDLMAF